MGHHFNIQKAFRESSDPILDSGLQSLSIPEIYSLSGPRVSYVETHTIFHILRSPTDTLTHVQHTHPLSSHTSVDARKEQLSTVQGPAHSRQLPDLFHCINGLVRVWRLPLSASLLAHPPPLLNQLVRAPFPFFCCPRRRASNTSYRVVAGSSSLNHHIPHPAPTWTRDVSLPYITRPTNSFGCAKA